jgi:hypothetical protein
VPITGASALPASVDHRAEGLEGPVKDQGLVGACTALSLSSAMEQALRRKGVQQSVSATHIWSLYGVPKDGRAADATLGRRIADDRVWPYDPAEACRLANVDSECSAAYDVQVNSAEGDPHLQAHRRAADDSARLQLVSVERVDDVRPDALAELLSQGDDLWAVFGVDRDAWKVSSLKNGVLRDYASKGSTGHAVVIAGYRTVGAGRQFLIHNSWGSDWGEGGYAWMSAQTLQRNLWRAYRVDAALPGTTPPAPPASPGRTPGSCPAGQSRDLLLQTCSPCPNGTVGAGPVCVPAAAFPFPLPTIPPWATPSDQPAACRSGQARDLVTGQCGPTCPGGAPSFGGLCLPGLR